MYDEGKNRELNSKCIQTIVEIVSLDDWKY